MKKIIGNFSLAIVAMALFFITNPDTNANDLDGAQLVAINSANAEDCTPGVDCNFNMQVCVTVNGNTYYGYPFHGCV